MKDKKVLIGNDDGISAPGILLLEELVSNFYDDITVIAPESNKSGASHSLTLMTPLRASEITHNHYSVSGSPADCMLYGLRYLFDKDEYPDLVLSGINNDANVAEDVIYSGTVAVAREAALFGIPAIAFSQQRRLDKSVSWDVARCYFPTVFKKIMQSFSFTFGTYLSVNFPAVNAEDVRGIKVVPQGVRVIEDRIVESIDPRGYPYYWVGAGDYRYDRLRNDYTDNCALDDGFITVVPMKVNATDDNALKILEGVCNEEFK